MAVVEFGVRPCAERRTQEPAYEEAPVRKSCGSNPVERTRLPTAYYGADTSSQGRSYHTYQYDPSGYRAFVAAV
jgi:hypothetical protein